MRSFWVSWVSGANKEMCAFPQKLYSDGESRRDEKLEEFLRLPLVLMVKNSVID